MNRKKVIVLPILTIFLLISAFSYAVGSEIAEAQARLVWNSEEWEGIVVEIYAPFQAYPNDTITIEVKANATKDLRDVYVILWLFGSKYENCSDWSPPPITVLYDATLHSGQGIDQNHDLEIPSDVDPGLIYGHIHCKWKTPDLEDHSKYDSFSVAYLKNKAFEELQSGYKELNSTYNSLCENYSELESNYSELESKYNASSGEITGARNLMYAFVATTAVSAATAIFLFIRRPRERWE